MSDPSTTPSTPASDAGYLGPGEVVTASARRVEARLGETEEVVPVELALTFPYRPAPGDRLVVLGCARAHYAVGVLSARAQPDLTFPGDVEVRSVGGTLSLRGDEGVEVEGPRLTLRAETLRTFAGALTEKADTAYRWVKDLLTVRAGQSRRVVDGEDYSQSERSVTLAKGPVKIDGDKVLLGH